MDKSDERWNQFVEAYGRLAERHGKLIGLTHEILAHPAFDDAETGEYYELLEKIKSGESISNS